VRAPTNRTVLVATVEGRVTPDQVWDGVTDQGWQLVIT
jgi:hypothetical protein